ncbi:MAG: putative cytokinetic ring protein SteA [Actinomycetota bacterium]
MEPGLSGQACVDHRTKDLAKRIVPGQIAVINHRDIDVIAAESLVARAPAAILNTATSISGLYPNKGPSIIVEAAIPLVDGIGDSLMTAVAEGEMLRLTPDGVIWRGDQEIAQGTVQNQQTVAAAWERARAGLSAQLEAFAINTMEYLRQERALLLDGVGIPSIQTKIAGRHVLVVVRGYHYREDLQVLRSYIREYRPVVIGVDGGADAVLDAGVPLHLIVGDMDSVSDRALSCGAEIVVHAYRDGRAPGLARVRELGVDPVIFPATGTSEDVAMLLADDMGAELIVAVGTHATLVEFLDKGRAGMSSTFLTRLRVGSKLVDAKGVSRLYRSRISTSQMLALLGCGLVALVAALSVTPAGQATLGLLGARWDDLASWLGGLFSW